MKALILSGMPAAGKTTVATAIAQKAGIPALGGGDILKEMARERGYTVTGEGWWDTNDGIRFLRERESNPDFDKEADRRMIEKIERGSIVVTSYTMPWLSKSGIKCWLDASAGTRAKRMVVRDSMPLEKAARVVALRDKENHDLYLKMYGIDLGADMKPFNIIVDVNTKTQDEIAEDILNEAKRYE
ncbi:MAG: cytidylate kinase family protein [Candidatus Marsarchaeota archaeon]|nr:cytidylate kinase family protein [Candidatus Marsarchaeota archaeon]